MYGFKVLNWNFNSKEVEYYDIMPYLIKTYKEAKEKPTTFAEFKDFVSRWGKYQWWSRAQYEIIISQWPPEKQNPHEEKIDVWDQVEQNLDLIASILKINVNEI